MTSKNKFFVYRNLHKKGVVYSMRNTKTKLVEKYQTIIVLQDVVFKVSKAGCNRVRLEKRKNVHAGVEGFEVTEVKLDKSKMRKASYNPYMSYSFYDVETKQPVYNAKYIMLDDTGLYYTDEEG